MKTRIVLLLLCLPVTLHAQRWLDLGAKAAWGPNFFYNQNYFDQSDFTNRLDFGYSFGGKLGFNLSLDHEITFDAGISIFNQKFNYDVAISEYSKTLQLRTTELMLLYRRNREGRYMEIGPGYSMLNRATATNQNPDITEGNNGDVSQYFVNGYPMAVFGFGAFMLGTDNVGLTFGARFKYALPDVISDAGKMANYPAGNTVVYEEYKGSHPLTVELVLELNWDFGYLAKANCGQRKKFLMF